MKRLVTRTAAILLIGISAQAFSQTNVSLSGVVRDSSRHTIPGVTVTATDNQTGAAVKVFTNEQGAYRFTGLAPGGYTVTAVLTGFRTLIATNIPIDSAPARYDFTLQISTVQGAIIPIPPVVRLGPDVTIIADNRTQEGSVTRFRGHVEMTTNSIILRADELDYDSNTQQVDPRGNVSIKILSGAARAILGR